MTTSTSLAKAYFRKAICLLLGVGLLGFSCNDVIDHRRLAAKAVRADGVITQMEPLPPMVKRGATGPCPTVTVRFITMRGQAARFSSDECGAPEQVGAAVKIRYDPDDPGRAEIDTLEARVMRWWDYIVGIILGFLVVTVNIVGLVSVARRSMALHSG
jgi:hypothetical protein